MINQTIRNLKLYKNSFFRFLLGSSLNSKEEFDEVKAEKIKGAIEDNDIKKIKKLVGAYYLGRFVMPMSDTDWETPLDFANKLGRKEIADYFKSKGLKTYEEIKKQDIEEKLNSCIFGTDKGKAEKILDSSGIDINDFNFSIDYGRTRATILDVAEYVRLIVTEERIVAAEEMVDFLKSRGAKTAEEIREEKQKVITELKVTLEKVILKAEKFPRKKVGGVCDRNKIDSRNN